MTPTHVSAIAPRCGRWLVFSVMALCVPFTASAQCSDAGACTISQHSEDGMDELSRKVGLRLVYGASGSPDEVSYMTAAGEADLELFGGSRVILTLPFSKQSGALGEVTGMGDLIVVWDQVVLRWEGHARCCGCRQACVCLRGATTQVRDSRWRISPGLGPPT